MESMADDGSCKGDQGTIPVFDLEKLRGDQLPGLRRACEQWGCFRLINHGITPQLLSQTRSLVLSFLDRPVEIKRRNVDVISGSGYVAPNELNPLYEAIGLYDVSRQDAIHEFCDQLDATADQRDLLSRYSVKMVRIAMDVASKIAMSMGLESDDENEYGLFRNWGTQFRMNKYGFSEETVGSTGVCVHTDSSFLTLLQDDAFVGGLEVMDRNGDFVAVNPEPGALLINLGDIAKVWSNGRFRNVKHRVQCKEASVRVSIALFLLGPKEGAVVSPPPLFVDSEYPRIYNAFTYEEYRKFRITSGLRDGDALAFFTA